MKAVFRATNHGGFISTTLAPANRSAEPRFGWADGMVVIGLLLGLVLLMRLVLAH